MKSLLVLGISIALAGCDDYSTRGIRGEDRGYLIAVSPSVSAQLLQSAVALCTTDASIKYLEKIPFGMYDCVDREYQILVNYMYTHRLITRDTTGE